MPCLMKRPNYYFISKLCKKICQKDQYFQLQKKKQAIAANKSSRQSYKDKKYISVIHFGIYLAISQVRYIHPLKPHIFCIKLANKCNSDTQLHQSLQYRIRKSYHQLIAFLVWDYIQNRLICTPSKKKAYIQRLMQRFSIEKLNIIELQRAISTTNELLEISLNLESRTYSFSTAKLTKCPI